MIAPAEPLPTIMVSNSWLWRRVHIHLTALLASFSSAKVTLKVVRTRRKAPIVLLIINLQIRGKHDGKMHRQVGRLRLYFRTQNDRTKQMPLHPSIR